MTILGLAQWAEGDWYVAKAVHTWRDTGTPEDRKPNGAATYETDSRRRVDVLPTDLDRHRAGPTASTGGPSSTTTTRTSSAG